MTAAPTHRVLSLRPDDRILVVAPTQADATLCGTVLGEASLAHVVVPDLPSLVEEMGRGAAVVLLTDEAFVDADARSLADALERQPAWSDVPILLMCARGTDSLVGAWAIEVLGNVTVLERPIRVTTLVSALRVAIRARQRQYELREADRRKDEFLATLSHELRNPLAPLRNCLHVLRHDGSAGSSARALYELMGRQVDHLVRLVDDLLELSRVTRGTLSLRIERVALAEFVRGAVETSEPAIAAGGHRLDVILPTQPLWLDGDPVRLAQIVANLLNNAARYTDPGGRIEVAARVDDGRLRLSVSDNGTGISAEALPRVFDMFSRGDRAQQRGESGLGIGLGIARRLAEMHGGTLEARSDGVGCGSEFVVSLPLARDGAPRAEGDARSEPPIAAVRILVVDDNEDAADSLRMVLEVLGAEVRIAHDGSEALAALAAWRPPIVLMDIGMPGMDGYETARRMRATAPGREATLVALTGWGQEEDRRRAVAAGFDHHLVKPAEIAALRALLASLGADEQRGVHPQAASR